MSNAIRGALRSLTIWVNGLAAAALAAAPVLQDSFPALQPYLGPDAYKYGMGAIVLANVLLRIRTSTSLADKGASK